MKKLKVNENILALMLLASFFAGWQVFVLAVAFIWGFCEMNDSLKSLSIKVGVVLGAVEILYLGWDVIVALKDLVLGGLKNVFDMLVSFGVTEELTYNTGRYLFNPVNYIFAIAESFVIFAALYVKLRFVLATVKNEELRGALAPVQSLINKMNNFVYNNFYEENKTQPASGNTKSSGGSGFCSQCGAKVDGKSPFCSSCGNKL